MSLSAAASFTQRLGTSVRAGVDLIQILRTEASHGAQQHRDAVQQLADGARRGEALSENMRRNRYFPPLLAAMTKVGEDTGRLEQTLLDLHQHYQNQLDIRRSFLRSIAWPLLQVVAGVMVLSLLIYVMGILTPATGGEMTDILGFGLRGGSGVLLFWFYLAVFFGVIALLIWGFIRNVAGVQNLIPLIYMVPVVGSALQTITLARFCRTLALSLEAGLDPIASIRLSLDSTDSDYYRSTADDAEQAIRAGSTLAGALEATDIFPREFIGKIDIAEQSGTDAESIVYLTREYDERAKSAMRMLSGAATIVVRATVICVFVFLIFRVASVYFDALNTAASPI